MFQWWEDEFTLSLDTDLCAADGEAQAVKASEWDGDGEPQAMTTTVCFEFRQETEDMLMSSNNTSATEKPVGFKGTQPNANTLMSPESACVCWNVTFDLCAGEAERSGERELREYQKELLLYF